MNTAEQFHVDQVSPSYWRAAFDNGPVNLLDPDTVEQLGALIGRIEDDPDLTVVVFHSDKPGYFMAHWDFLADNARVAGDGARPTGLHPYLDNFIRLSRAAGRHDPEIRGRARGAGSEFVLATDIRFASEKAVLGQFEVGVGAVPGGGPMARLGRLVGRGRALRSCSAARHPAGPRRRIRLREPFGPGRRDRGLHRCVRPPDRGLRQVAVAGIKKLVDVATLPADEEFAPGLAVVLRYRRRPGEPAVRPSSCSRTASSSPTASRPTSAPRSQSCDRTPTEPGVCDLAGRRRACAMPGRRSAPGGSRTQLGKDLSQAPFDRPGRTGTAAR